MSEYSYNFLLKRCCGESVTNSDDKRSQEVLAYESVLETPIILSFLVLIPPPLDMPAEFVLITCRHLATWFYLYTYQQHSENTSCFA